MREIEIIPSDKAIKEMYELENKLKFSKLPSYKEYYGCHKKPMKALFG